MLLEEILWRFPTTENIKTLKVDGVEVELNRIEYEITKFTTSDKSLTYNNDFSYSGNFYKIETTLKNYFIRSKEKLTNDRYVIIFERDGSRVNYNSYQISNLIESSGVTFTDEYTLDVTSFCQKNIGYNVSFLFSYNPLLRESKHTIGGVIECENEYIRPIPKVTKTEFDTTKDNFTEVGLTEENVIGANRIEITLSEEPLQLTQDEETMSMTAEVILIIENGEYWNSKPQIAILNEAIEGGVLTKIDESDNKRYTLNLGGFSLSTFTINFAFFHVSGKMEELNTIMTNKESFDTYLKEHFNQTKTSIIREDASSNYNFTENKVYEVEYEQFEHHKPINFSSSCIKELEKGALMYNDTMPELINTSIEVIEIPFNVDNKDIFSTLPLSLKKVTVDFRNKTFDSRGNCNAIIDSKTNTLIKAFGNFTIPNTVQHIADNAFYGCGEIEELIFPDSVITIGNNLFRYDDEPKVKKIVLN